MRTVQLQIRVKQWFLIKNDMFKGSPNSSGYTSSSWLRVIGETDKAYKLDGLQMSLHTQWIPKSCVLEVREA